MTVTAFAADLTAYVLQSSLILGVGLLLPVLFRLRDARAALLYWQGLLVAVLLLPLFQPEPVRAGFSGEMTVTSAWLGQIAETGESNSGSLLLGVLGLGALLRLAWLGLGLLTLRSWRRGARPVSLAPEVLEIADAVGARALLLVSGRVESPVTFGWRSPVVLLPAGFPELPPATQRGVLCHELLHVRRRDWLAALFEEGMRALLWFHPGVWMLLARIALSREQVVDLEAVRLTGSRRAYLEALRVFAGSWQAVPGLPFFHRGHLLQRVTHLCKEVPMSRPRIATLVTTFAGLLALTAFLAVLAFPMAPIASTAWAEPLKVEGNVKPPKIVNKVQPEYPESAREAKLEGTVAVKTVIDEQGRVRNPTVAKSSGNADFDRSALDAVAQWTFQPATLDGKRVEVYYTITIRFTPDK
ncbi:MAG TPA: M56 family metallopeptidase [Thermoanaerobaculia bacterium]|nr:M56 family metallopeptidase [Thermoanaerobaculia bacterium]